MYETVFVYTCTKTAIYKHVYIYIQMLTYMWIYIYVYTYMYIYMYMYVNIHTSMCMYMYVYVYIYRAQRLHLFQHHGHQPDATTSQVRARDLFFKRGAELLRLRCWDLKSWEFLVFIFFKKTYARKKTLLGGSSHLRTGMSGQFSSRYPH